MIWTAYQSKIGGSNKMQIHANSIRREHNHACFESDFNVDAGTVSQKPYLMALLNVCGICMLHRCSF